MFVSLLLVAFFGCASSSIGAAASDVSCAAVTKRPPKCDYDMIRSIYAYWEANDGVPRNQIEHAITCHNKEIALVSTPLYFGNTDVSCAVIHHRANSLKVYLKINNFTYINDAVVIEFHGQVLDPLGETVQMTIEESNHTRLQYKCSHHSDAQEGSNQFVISAVEGQSTQEDIDALLALMSETFGVTEDLVTYATTCPLQFEDDNNDDDLDDEVCTHDCDEE